MPILPTEANFDNSPFYKIMEDRGRLWSRVADEVGAEIKGFYNAFSLEFELNKSIDNNLLKVSGRRRLEYVNNRRIVAKDLLLDFICPGLENEKHLKIGREGLMNFFYNRSGRYNYKINVDEFRIKYNSKPVVERIFRSKILSIHQISRVTVDKKGIHVRVLDLPKRVDEARMLVNFWKVFV